MIPLIWLKGILAATVTALILGTGYAGFSKIKSLGYNEATAKYSVIIEQQRVLIENKITAIENNSNVLILEGRESQQLLNEDIAQIIKKLNTKPLTIIKEGKCTPSSDFSTSINDINKRVNAKIKGETK